MHLCSIDSYNQNVVRCLALQGLKIDSLSWHGSIPPPEHPSAVVPNLNPVRQSNVRTNACKYLAIKTPAPARPGLPGRTHERGSVYGSRDAPCYPLQVDVVVWGCLVFVAFAIARNLYPWSLWFKLFSAPTTVLTNTLHVFDSYQCAQRVQRGT